MEDNRRKIGIALSGGGIRAAIFHLGVLKWMAENKLLEDIACISSVSGASLGIGLVYAHNSQRWPDSMEYLNTLLPKIKEIILSEDIQSTFIRKLIFSPWWWGRRVNLLAKVLEKHWGIFGELTELSAAPMWTINCTTFETGKRFRFSQQDMGDYIIGYVNKPKIPLADAIAASAGLPVFFGPYKVKTDHYIWTRPDYTQDIALPKDKYIHLWDGGVYDNLGLEAIYKIEGGGSLRKGVNYLTVSNASKPIEYKRRECGLKNLKRLLEIAMDQVLALRSRDVMDYFKRTEYGVYFKIGNSAQYIVKDSSIPEEQKWELIAQCLSETDVAKARDYPTTLSRPSEADFELLLRHGYEVAKCTNICYGLECAGSGSDAKVFV